MADWQEFLDNLKRGPSVLFLGQDYLQLETGTDPVLLQIRGEFGRPTDTLSYDLLLGSTTHLSSDSVLTWMWEHCRRVSPPEWLHSVSAYPWNSVFSSAIDPLWLPTFRNEWREVAPIHDDEYFPRDPRNRHILHCTYLFGSVNATEPKSRPPLSQFEFLNRKQAARNLAQRLPDVLTPLGILAIEGYQGEEDWFSWEDFFPVLQNLGRSQANLFGVNDEILSHPIVAELVRMGVLTTYTERLAWVLEQGADSGYVRLGVPDDWEEGGRRVPLRHTSISIPRELWNRVSNSATLLDEHVLAPAPAISKDALYWEFRRFLFECGTRPLWSGFDRGFAFRREFEGELQELALKQVSREVPTDEPVIIHGQTGTGKTVGLGSLAYTVAKSGNYPVIFIERKTQRPSYPDIDECCRWLEDHGAKATLIVWDGMVQQSDYHELQGYLASRGRKAVVVGSSYSLNESGSHLVEVPDQLSVSEAHRFAEFLEKMGISLSRFHRDALEKRDPSYLVALYRYLTPTRPQITTGVVQELEQLEQDLVLAVNQLESAHPQFGTLAEALLAAGVIDRSKLEQVGRRPSAEISTSDIAELVDMVMVPGRFGLSIPIELLARTWEQPNYTDIAQIFRSFDVIQAVEDQAGRIVVGPRHSLEAQLIVRARLGSIQSETDIVSRIVKAVRPWRWGADESDEISFVIELLRAVGPQGDEQFRFAPFFRAIAEAISEVRESRNIRSPRIMLQEANLYREWVTSKSRQGERPEDAAKILDKAKSILQEALELLEDNRQWRLRTFIATELASTLGTATIDSIESGANIDEIEENFRQVLSAVQTARGIDFNHYNPVDVLVWSTTAFTQLAEIDDIKRTEAIVDVLDALETVDPDMLNSSNIENFHRRRYEIGNLLGDRELSESAFQSLLDVGSAAGFYLRAMEIGGPITSTGSVNERTGYSHKEAWSYLERNRSHIEHDSRCLNLLFDYWWLWNTGRRPFDGERAFFNLSQEDWSYGLQLIRELKALATSHRGPILSFLEAIALFHLDQTQFAMQLFREVENESYMVSSRRRIFRSFLASESTGQPRVFHGTVSSIALGGRRGQVFVEEIRQHVTFLPTDFGRPEIRRGDSLGEFHIAFNFIGPIADPPTRSQS